MATSNVSHDLALIHYGYSDFIPISNEIRPSRLIREGLTYVSFSRAKNIGNILNLTFIGKMPDIYVGDWIVLKTTSKGKFSPDSGNVDYYLDKGLVRFIGQIYLINSQYTADADGILRKTYNVSVREWSHCLNIPVRYSDQIRLLSLNADSQSQEVKANVKSYLQKNQKVASPEVQKFLDSDWREYVTTRKPAFEIIKNVLTMIGIRSFLSEAVQQTENSWIYLTTSRLPAIPAQIYEDHIYKYSSEKYEEDFAFNTGFLKSLIGVQKWGEDTQLLAGDIFSPNAIDSIVNENAKRPVTFVSSSLYSEGRSFPEVVKAVLDSGGEYELYSDLLYISDSPKNMCKPILVIRDKPISFRALESSSSLKKYKESEQDFGFTYKDSIPRITIPLNHVIGLSVGYSSQESYNYIHFNPLAKILNDTYAQSISYREGRYKDVASQKRFGGQEYFANVGEFLTSVNEQVSEAPPPPKIVMPKDKTSADKKKGSQPEAEPKSALSIKWFQALTQKYRYYMPIKHAMPNATVQIIDNDFPLTVGLMLRIELGQNKPTICGEIQEISYTTNINSEGKITNQTYVKITDVLMENPENSSELIIIPKQFTNTLFIDTTQYNEENDIFLNTRREN